ncbi:hypothetical protein BB560_002011 [Smittium megazygosporum]|uniref:Major facilitator superfamily (MFS) profile domain-containing protein n=1 Tax=Smittium megazygosporum TaxID=133381 RepID=A0A2T9ZG02_9FUNG|nr:hypothetical protein BB560_002011 [Smittium megazygosporum]
MKILHSREAVVFLVFCSLLIDVAIYGIVIPALPKLLQDKFGSPVSLNGLFVAIFGFGVLIGAPSSSYVSDKYSNRRLPMIIGFIIFAGGSLGIAFANSLVVLYISRGLQGVGSGVTWAVGLAAVIDIYPAEILDTPMSIVYTGLTIGATGGPIVGGVVFKNYGQHGIGYLMFGAAILILIIRIVIPDSDQIIASLAQEQNNPKTPIDLEANPSSDEQKIYIIAGPSADSKSTKDLTEPSSLQSTEKIDKQITYWGMIKQARIGLMSLIVVFAYGLVGSVEVVVPISFSEKGLDSDKIGYSFIALTIGSAIGGLLMGKVLESKYMTNKFGPYKKRFVVILIGNTVAGILTLFLGLSKPIPLSIVFLGLIGLFFGAGNVPVMSALGAHIQTMSKGSASNSNSKVYSLYNIAYSLAAMVMPTVSSVIYKATNLFISCLILGLLLIGFTIVSMLYLIFYTDD